ncbi:MAG TPA: hypothetical protein VG269_07285 [Tepidisphaeraceae bacterium]|jgi:hypothetical protein|nr:hypothetical protein [Tepidisphaeraceae bacterium]
MRLIIDRRRQYVKWIRLISAFARAWEAADLKAVRIEIIIRPRTDKRDSVNVLLAAKQIAGRFGLPIETQGQSRRARKDFAEVLRQIRAGE